MLNYTFVISQFSLTANKYPFDFFIRISSLASKQAWEGPKVSSETLSFEETLPWKFLVSTDKLMLEFIENAGQEPITEIKRATAVIESDIKGEQKQIALLNERTDNPVCILTYSLCKSTEPKGRIMKKYVRDIILETTKNGQHNKKQRMQKEELTHINEKIVAQLVKLNETLDKMLTHEEKEHESFTKYLSESTTLIKELAEVKKQEQQQKQKLDKAIQREEQEGEQQRGRNQQINWKIQQQQQQLEQAESDRSSDEEKRQNQQKQPQKIEFKEQQQEDQFLQSKKVGSNYPLEQHQKKQLQVSEHKEASKSELFLDTHEKWYKQKYGHTSKANLGQNEQNRTYYYDSTEEEMTIVITGLQVQMEQKPIQIDFYLKEAESKLIAKLACNKGRARWNHDLVLPSTKPMEVNVLGEDGMVTVGQLGQKQLKQNQCTLYDANLNQAGKVKFRSRKIQKYGIQTAEIYLSKNEEEAENGKNISSQQENNSQKDEKNEQRHQLEDQKESRKNQVQIDEKDIVQEKAQGKIMTENQKEEADKVEKMASSRTNPIQNTHQQSQPVQGDQQRKKFPIKIKSSREKSIDIKKSQICLNKEQKPQSRKYQASSNSLNAYYIPFNVTENEKKQYQLENLEGQRLKSEEPSQRIQSEPYSLTSNRTQPQINLRITSINAKLFKNDYAGKYVKLSLPSHQPFVTETINCNPNLSWKGNGYLFQNVSLSDQLSISIFSDNGIKTSLVGMVKILVSTFNHKSSNVLCFIHEDLLNSENGAVGEIIIGYENMSKKNRISTSRKKQDIDSDGFKSLAYSISPKKKKVSRNKSLPNYVKKKQLPKLQKTKKTRKLAYRPPEHKIIESQSSAIRQRKYTGGNVLFGKAPRFRVKFGNQPGPGEYEIHSTFERHASPDA